MKPRTGYDTRKGMAEKHKICCITVSVRTCESTDLPVVAESAGLSDRDRPDWVAGTVGCCHQGAAFMRGSLQLTPKWASYSRKMAF